jgi:hypothetical protein
VEKDHGAETVRILMDEADTEAKEERRSHELARGGKDV